MEPAVVVRIHPGQLPNPIPKTRRRMRSLSVRWTTLLGLAIWAPAGLVLPARATAGQNAGRTEATTSADSLQTLAKAREIQRDFERFHRTRLPFAREDWRSDCDERVGQMCLRYDEGEETPTVPEDSALVASREALLDSLAHLGEIIPGDRWILGQRIRYLTHLGRWDQAASLARGCVGGPPWWCPAMVGFVQHRSGNTVEALDSFEAALALMPAPQAAEWRDPSELLEYPSARWLRGTPGVAPEEAHTRFWWMADPLFLTPGNERLAEHLARRFAAFLNSDAASTMVVGWNRNREAILIRYGFVAKWQRARPSLDEVGGGSVVLHWHPESRNLLPPLEALEDPGGVPEGVWLLSESGARSASAPILAPLMVEGRTQTATLRREGDLLVVAAFGVPTDSVLEELRGSGEKNGKEGVSERPHPPWEISARGASPDTLSGLFLFPADGPWGPLGVVDRTATGTLQVRAPPGGYLLSMELWNPSGRWASRVRHGVRAEAVPPDVPTLSDILLLDSGPSLPRDLEAALPRMKPETSLAPEERFAVAWEVYGLGRRGEPLTFNLSLVEEEGSLIRRAFKWTGLFNKTPPLSISWTEGGPGELGPFFRAVDLDLPPLEPGRYVLRLELQLPNRSLVVSHRRIQVF